MLEILTYREGESETYKSQHIASFFILSTHTLNNFYSSDFYNYNAIKWKV